MKTEDLTYVFAQLRLIGAKGQDEREGEPRYHLRLTPFEKIQLRRQMREDFRRSLEDWGF